jgi:enoyl-CoA hydratase/carnithine racemase
MTQLTDGRILMERDSAAGIARLTFNRPERRNSYDPAMRQELGDRLDEIAEDDEIKVVLLRGEGGVFSTGADMANAYAWYADGKVAGATNGGQGDGTKRPRRPSQRRRLAVDRKSFDFYHSYLGYPKVTVAEVRGYALGGGFELALMSDISVVAADTVVGMPATRLLGPALGTLHLFFYRLGPVLARRLLLTGDTVEASTLERDGVFTEVVSDAEVAARADWWARKIARMPADGIVMAKEAFRLVEQLQAYHGEETLSYMIHAYGTNLQFEEGEFNFVKARAKHGTSGAFELRDAHFELPEP